MAKYGIQKGDKIIVRPPATRQEGTGKIIAYHDPRAKPLTVTKVWAHGVRTQGYGYVHNNSIVGKYVEAAE